MTGAGPDDAVRRALALISAHPGVDGMGAPQIVSASGITTVDVTFQVNLPSEWRRRGEPIGGQKSGGRAVRLLRQLSSLSAETFAS